MSQLRVHHSSTQVLPVPSCVGTRRQPVLLSLWCLWKSVIPSPYTKSACHVREVHNGASVVLPGGVVVGEEITKETEDHKRVSLFFLQFKQRCVWCPMPSLNIDYQESPSKKLPSRFKENPPSLFLSLESTKPEATRLKVFHRIPNVTQETFGLS